MKEIKNLKLEIPILSDPVSKGAFSLSLRMQLPPKLPFFKTLHTFTMSEPCLPLLALLLQPDGLPLSEKKKKVASSDEKKEKKASGCARSLPTRTEKPGNGDPLIAWRFLRVAGWHASHVEKKKKKNKKEKKKCKLCKPCEFVTRPVEANGHRKSSEMKLPPGSLFAPRDPAPLICLLLRRNCNIFVAARPSLPRPSMTPIHPPRAGQPTPREPPYLAIPRSAAVSTIHFAEGGRRLC